jgi:hypothetical protein
MATTKRKNNDQMFKALFKEIEGTMYSALLRERIVAIMDMTMQSIEEEGDKWANGFISPNMYKDMDVIVKKHLGFDNK